jgi:hypothetical protein
VPVARIESICILLALAAQEGWHVHHMDIKSTFLNGDLKEEVYGWQPPVSTIFGQGASTMEDLVRAVISTVSLEHQAG